MTKITIPCDCGRSYKIDVGFALPEETLAADEESLRPELAADRDRWKRIALSFPPIWSRSKTEYGFHADGAWRDFPTAEEAMLAWDEWQQSQKKEAKA